MISGLCENKITILIISFIGFPKEYMGNKDECNKGSILALCFTLTLPDTLAFVTLEADIISCSALSNWKFHLIKMQFPWKQHSSDFVCRQYRKKSPSIYKSEHIGLNSLLVL